MNVLVPGLLALDSVPCLSRADSKWHGTQAAFPSSLSLASFGCGQWELLMGDYRVGEEEAGYSSSLLLRVQCPEQLLPLLGTSLPQACPPGLGSASETRAWAWDTPPPPFPPSAEGASSFLRSLPPGGLITSRTVSSSLAIFWN